ncbi:hypothetical protein P4E94_16850 [Pontiellaceae bacterium B12219]|nr:hypothetical protein [Pontiellaceae bacterium B12219]
MNYPRVNLLKKGERRYQGKVSKDFIILVGAGVPLLIVLLVMGLFFANKAALKKELESTRVLWKQLEPRMKTYAKDNKELATTRQILELFEGWEASQTSFVKLLNDIQDAVPPSVQFTRMSVQTGTSRPLYKTAGELQLQYNLTIDGLATGAEAENEVIMLQKGLLAREQIGNTFSTLKLASLKTRADASGGNMCDFRLVGENSEGAK